MSHVTYEEFEQFKHHVEERFMTTQADIDTITATVDQVAIDLGTVQTDLTSATSTLQDEINTLAEANPSLDLTALQAAVAPLDQTVQALDASVKALGSAQPQQEQEQPAPTPAPEPTPEPDPTPAPTPEPDPAPQPAAFTSTDQLAQPVYTTTGDTSAVNATAWPSTGYETPSSQLLFYYSDDAAGSPTANGAGLDGGVWTQYQGAIQQVPAAA
jgi:hypothetical protein